MSRFNLFSASTIALLTVACAEVPTLSIGGEPLPASSSTLTASSSGKSRQGQSAIAEQAPEHYLPSIDLEALSQEQAPPSINFAPVHPILPRQAPGPEQEPERIEEEPTVPEQIEEELELPTELGAGDLCSYSVSAWASGCKESKDPGCLLQGEDFKASYPDGMSIGRAPLQVTLSDMIAVASALPPQLDAAPLTESLIDPSNLKVDALSAELIALTLNMEISARGMVGSAHLEELRVADGPFAGDLVYTVYEEMNGLLSGDDSALERYGMDIDALTEALAEINAAGEGCTPSGLLKR